MITELPRCTRCHDWNACLGKYYYHPNDIVQYCWYQVMWLTAKFLICYGDHIIIERDAWPGEVESSAESPKTQSAISSRAPFVSNTENMVIIEKLVERLDRTDKDGRMLVLELGMKESCDATRRNLSKDARAALYFVSGRKDKAMPYEDWLNQRERRTKLKPVGLQNSQHNNKVTSSA